jgi:hypothetical protein
VCPQRHPVRHALSLQSRPPSLPSAYGCAWCDLARLALSSKELCAFFLLARTRWVASSRAPTRSFPCTRVLFVSPHAGSSRRRRRARTLYLFCSPRRGGIQRPPLPRPSSTSRYPSEVLPSKLQSYPAPDEVSKSKPINRAERSNAAGSVTARLPCSVHSAGSIAFATAELLSYGARVFFCRRPPRKLRGRPGRKRHCRTAYLNA